MPVIARFFGITIKMYLRQKNTIRHISMQFTVIIQDYFQLKAVKCMKAIFLPKNKTNQTIYFKL